MLKRKMQMNLKSIIIAMIMLSIASVIRADNPLVTHIYTADPSARVFNDTLYIFPSHDIDETPTSPGYNGFRMEDYHVYSTTDLMNYTDHGVILKDEDVDWVSNTKDAMWAPDCNVKNGKYYFYFPGDFKIGVAIANHPTGPYTPVQKSIKNANQIDPNIFIDDDGTPYLYFGGGDYLNVMRLKDDMITPDMDPQKIESLQVKNYKEGPWMFKRKGIYYFTYPVDLSGSEQIHYAIGDNPLGPFTPQGTIMDGWTDGCWTNHHSIVEYRGQWYIFYHHKDISGDQSLRSMCADKVFFNEDGSIQKVNPTLRGIGIRKANEKIQIDRYSEKSNVEIGLHNDHEPTGWKVQEIQNEGWIRYNDVDFESKSFVKVIARIASNTENCKLEIREGSYNGKLISSITLPNTGNLSSWKTVSAKLDYTPEGIQDLVCVFKTPTNNSVVINWVQFVEEGQVMISKSGTGNGLIKTSNKVILDTNSMSERFPISQVQTYTLSTAPLEHNEFEGWILNGVQVDAITQINPNDEIEALFNYNPPPRKATSQIEAEDFNEQQGVQAESCSEGGQNIGFIQNNDFIKFDDIDFGIGVKEINVRASSDGSGGQIKVYIDKKAGTPIATINIQPTGGWQNWKTIKASVKNVTGIHDLYLVFTGSTGYLFNLNWIQFTELPSLKGEIENSSLPFLLYPNPIKNSSAFFVEYYGTQRESYQITNMRGEIIAKGILEPGINVMDSFHSYIKGAYIFTTPNSLHYQIFNIFQ